MKVRDMMTKDVPLLRPGNTLRLTVELFRETRLTSLPVADETGKLVGVFTRFNLFDSLLEGHGLHETIDSFYTRHVITERPDGDYVEIPQDIVKKSRIGTRVVVDDDNHVMGVFTKANMIMALFKQSDLLNARLQAVYRAMYNGLIKVDLHEKLLLVNPSAEKMLGVKEKDVIGKPIAEIFPELKLKDIINTGKSKVVQKHILRGRAVVVNCSPVMCGKEIVGAIAIFQDLTELEQVAAELETVMQLHNTLQTVLEIAYDGIIVVDHNGMVVLINRALADYLKVNPQDVIGKYITDVLENSRLHVVARTGVPEYAGLQTIGEHSFLVSSLPIVKNNAVTGAVGKIMFWKLEKVQEMAKRLSAAEGQVSYYRKELEKVGGIRYTFDNIISISSKMNSLKTDMARAARGQSTILIQGESGTGKELFAQAIHSFGSRRSGPFIKINCAAIPDNLLESELFGYDHGAFTGARKGGKPGKFEMAHGGTIFLDEIGEMNPALQSKLLNVLEDKEFERVGGTQSMQVDVRIIAATNRDLKGLVAEGIFREDLYYRLNVITLGIPPLREHKEDILPLAHHFLRKYNTVFESSVEKISAEVLKVLQSYHWPGNIRELENVIERAVNFSCGKTIEVSDLPPYLTLYSGTCLNKERSLPLPSYREKINEAEKDVLMGALDVAGGNKTKAASILGISRSRLYVKLKKCGLLG